MNDTPKRQGSKEATAKLNQITEVYSEDFNSGAIVEGVRFTNPFSDDFKLL
ncbi:MULTISPECIES: hypothetical protein [Oscillatoriales]|uniref:hypothetical protein n=1 Tax=Oscillatoriophycideae TaxID=1301283 RepID=UPI0018EFDE92|nr:MULTISPECIES: hypothetical protein [Oscillatoriales]